MVQYASRVEVESLKARVEALEAKKKPEPKTEPKE